VSVENLSFAELSVVKTSFLHEVSIAATISMKNMIELKKNFIACKYPIYTSMKRNKNDLGILNSQNKN
jgi:hypothetical protein